LLLMPSLDMISGPDSAVTKVVIAVATNLIIYVLARIFRDRTKSQGIRIGSALWVSKRSELRARIRRRIRLGTPRPAANESLATGLLFIWNAGDVGVSSADFVKGNGITIYSQGLTLLSCGLLQVSDGASVALNPIPVSGPEAKLPGWPKVQIASLPPGNGFVLSFRYRVKDGESLRIGYRAPIPHVAEIAPVRNLVVTNMKRWRKYRVGAPFAFVLSIGGFIGMIATMVWLLANVVRVGHIDATYFKGLLVMVIFEGIWLAARDRYAEREKVIPKGLRVWKQTLGEPVSELQLDLAVGKQLARRKKQRLPS